MSFFGVTIEKVGFVQEVPDSLYLDMIKPVGKDIQGIVGRGLYKVGDSFLLIPVDALVPEELLVKLNLSGKLNGKQKNRVSTRLLRKCLSQCLPAPMSLLEGLSDLSTESITAYLGITKYEPPEVPCQGGVLYPLPFFCKHYDIESCDRFTDVADYLMDMPVYITEKLEGTNWSISYDVVADKIYINQRNYTIVEEGAAENMYWRAARKQDMITKVKELAKILQAKNTLSIYGELLGPGIQGNIYQLKESQVFPFDVKMDGVWQEFSMFSKVSTLLDFVTVPRLAVGITLRDWLDGKTVKEKSTGRSVLNNTIYREGIVIKPMDETYSEILAGRLFLKQRSPEYLMGNSPEEAKG